MFCKARKIPLPLQDRVKEKLETMVRQGILEPVQPGGVKNTSPVLSQWKKHGALRLCVDLKVHINGKVMDENYTIPDMETIFHNLHGASYFGKIDLSDAKNSSSIFQNCIESKESRVWSYSKTTFWYMEQQMINTRNECLQSGVGYVKKTFHHH